MSATRAIARDIRTVDLNIDGGRQTKVQCLGDNVSRKKIERSSGKLAGELLAQRAHVVCGRVMLLFERDEHVGIGRAGEPRVVVDVVDVADRQADVVEDIVDLSRRNRLPDAGLDLVR